MLATDRSTRDLVSISPRLGSFRQQSPVRRISLAVMVLSGALACSPQVPKQVPAASSVEQAAPSESTGAKPQTSSAAASPAPAPSPESPATASTPSIDSGPAAQPTDASSAGAPESTPQSTAVADAGSAAGGTPAAGGAEVPSGKPGKATAFWAGSGKRQDKASWTKLAKDGLHDGSNPGLPYLQNPREALSALPVAKSGDYVDWVAALKSGAIQPRATVRSAGSMELLDLNIEFTETKNMPAVTFPHLSHTEWLGCKNCHDNIFVAKRGANPIAMADIMAGKACGRCHGRVAFPLNQCFACHNGRRPGQTQPASGP